MRKLALILCALILCTGFISLTPPKPVDVMMLVNKTHPLAEDYVPANLVTANVRFASGTVFERTQMAQPAAAALEKLFAGAEKDGITLYGVSGYRSYYTQKGIYSARLAETSQDYVDKYIAKPGQSEHQTGLAIDILDRDSRNLTESFADTEAYAWLQAHAWEYGFIIRYPQDGVEETGYAFEPWHIRYLGPAAGDVYHSGLTYEAWLDSRGIVSASRGRLPLIAR